MCVQYSVLSKKYTAFNPNLDLAGLVMLTGSNCSSAGWLVGQAVWQQECLLHLERTECFHDRFNARAAIREIDDAGWN